MNSCTYNLRPAKYEYQTLVNRITARLQIHNIEVYESSTPNACATLYKQDGYHTPIISYNRYFMEKLERQNEWVVPALFIHEVAHHYNEDVRRHPYNSDESHRRELNADWLVGFMLACEGATLAEAQALYYNFSKFSSRSHPGRIRRLNAVARGWSKGECLSRPPNRVTQPRPQKASIDGEGALVALGLLALVGIGAAILSD